MFTGLITAVGTLEAITAVDDGLELTVTAPYHDLVAGESIAINGACLTVTTCEPGRFRVHVVQTSLGRTAFGDRRVGDPVNLERALRLGDRLGGHLVQGHVDGVGQVLAVRQEGDAWLIDVTMPGPVAEVTIPLGSITIDGVSLTANALLARDVVQLSIIPFTLEHTALGRLTVGARVHLEGDMVGKHIRALAERWQRAPEGQ